MNQVIIKLDKPLANWLIAILKIDVSRAGAIYGDAFERVIEAVEKGLVNGTTKAIRRTREGAVTRRHKRRVAGLSAGAGRAK